MRIAIASDHAAIELKAELSEWLIEEGHEVADLGPEPGASVDYPDYGYRLAEIVAEGTVEYGIALCGSGIGISISVNRHPQVRCALVSEPPSAALAREHNDANCIAMGARLVGIEMAKACVDAVTYYNDPKKLAELSTNLGKAMKGLEIDGNIVMYSTREAS